MKLADLNGHTFHVQPTSFSPNGKRIVAASENNNATIWDAESGVILANLIGHSSYVRSASFSPDGKKVVTASWDNTAKIWDAGIIN